MITNALSVDVEEYFHAAIFRRATAAIYTRRFESRVEQSVERLLALLSEHHAQATFFVLGEIAALHPGMIQRIQAEGHEIASHGECHEDVHRQSPNEFRLDIQQAKARIEDVIGQQVIGYRAPNFSIGPAQKSWAYEILGEEGFRYDSSVFPIVHDRYGQPGAARFPHEVWRSGSNSLVEFPIGTARVSGVNLPLGGGGYFRLLPVSLLSLGIRHVNACERQPVMFYVHPWELDPDQPRPPMSRSHRFRHYVGVSKSANKLGTLLRQFRFGSARQVLTLGKCAGGPFHTTIAPRPSVLAATPSTTACIE